MTICNMTIEGGGRAGMIAPDETTFAWVEAPAARRRDRRRGRAGATCTTDDGAAFDREIVGRRRARSARWSRGARRRRWSSASPTRVPEPQDDGDERALEYMGLRGRHADRRTSALDRVFIGSCTNSRIGDLRAAAEVVEGRKVADGVYAMVVPGSVQVKRQAEAEGLDEVFRAAGFDWRGAGCSMCLGMNPDIARARASAAPRPPTATSRAARAAAAAPTSSRPQMAAAAADRGPLRRHPGLELSMEPIAQSSKAPSRCSTATTSTPTRSSPSSSSSASSAPASASSSSTTGPRSPAGTCRPTRSSSPGATSAAARRASTRRGRSRTTASRRSSRRLRRHLLLQLHEDRPAARRARPRTTSGAIADAGEAEIDLAAQEVALGGRRRTFDIDPEIKHRLLNGLDDIALTLQQERGDRRPTSATRERPGPVTTAL